MVNMCLITEQLKMQDKRKSIAKIHECIKSAIKGRDSCISFSFTVNVGSQERRDLSDKGKRPSTVSVKMELCFQVRAEERSIHDPINIPVNDRHGMNPIS